MFRKTRKFSKTLQMIIILIFLLSLSFSEYHPIITGNSENNRLQYIQNQLEGFELLTPSGTPVFSDCYKNAMEELNHGCESLTSDEYRTRFAFRLMQCHLSKSNYKEFKCDPSMTILECTAPLNDDSIAYNAFSQFVTHVEALCFFLATGEFNKMVERAVLSVLDILKVFEGDVHTILSAQRDSAEKINEIRDNGVIIKNGQEEIMENQEKMDEINKAMFFKISNNLENVETMSVTIGNEVRQAIKEAEIVKRIVRDFSGETEKSFSILKDTNVAVKTDLSATLELSKELYQKQEEFDNSLKVLKEDHSKMKEAASYIKKIQEEIKLSQGDIKVEQEKLLDEVEINLKKFQDITYSINERIRNTDKLQGELYEKMEETKGEFDVIGRKLQSHVDFTNQKLKEILDNYQISIKKAQENAEEFAANFGRLFGDTQMILDLFYSFLGEWMTVETIIYYIAIIIIIYFVTSTKSTERCRILLYLICAINFFIEKYIIINYTPIYSSQVVKSRISMARKFMIIVYLGIIFFTYNTFMNYDKINYYHLKENNMYLKQLLSIGGRGMGKRRSNRKRSRRSDFLREKGGLRKRFNIYSRLFRKKKTEFAAKRNFVRKSAAK